MPFPDSVRQIVLTNSHRHCCVCHKFAGLEANVHHIVQEANGGANTIDNAICLCFSCHMQAGHYNPQHPMGTKYSPNELKLQRDQWWELCSRPPANNDSVWQANVAYGGNDFFGRGGTFDVSTEIRKAQVFLKKTAPMIDGIYNDLRSGGPRSLSHKTFEDIDRYRYWQVQAFGVDHPERFFNQEYEGRRNSVCTMLSKLAYSLKPLNYISYMESSGRPVYRYQNAKLFLDEEDKNILEDIYLQMKSIIATFQDFERAAR